MADQHRHAHSLTRLHQTLCIGHIGCNRRFHVTPKHPAASATLRTVPAVRVAR
jgi:hypothetical protein